MQNTDGMLEYENTYFKNGNVKTQYFAGNYNNSFAITADLNFTNTYDKSNRLLKSTTNVSTKSYETENTYDKDGNMLTLKRFGSTGSYLDNFTYSYYSGTNKLQRVTGSTAQYTYDANGNMTRDDINNNRDVKYDHRNLITQILHKETVIEDSIIYLTFYNYDEAGNRYAKTVFKYTAQGEPKDIPDQKDIINSEDWRLEYYEIYSRDISGRELGIYRNEEVIEYPLYRLDMIGKLESDVAYYYHKDHLGSIRAVVNSSNELESAQDYDPWGYLLSGRAYQSSESKFKFTEKERDEESFYDYFGARYYDSRIANWTSVDPLMEKHFNFAVVGVPKVCVKTF